MLSNFDVLAIADMALFPNVLGIRKCYTFDTSEVLIGPDIRNLKWVAGVFVSLKDPFYSFVF